jgi:hypothetical protein
MLKHLLATTTILVAFGGSCLAQDGASTAATSQTGTMDATAQPVTSLLEWAEQLSDELGVERHARAATYADLMQQIVRVNRNALAA